jgi:hypothetical protein
VGEGEGVYAGEHVAEDFELDFRVEGFGPDVGNSVVCVGLGTWAEGWKSIVVRLPWKRPLRFAG